MSTVAQAPASTGRPSGAPARWRALDALSVAAAAAPFGVVAVVHLVSGHLVLGGDQALIGLDALDARHLDQGVGSYSRMGWAHPGPAWTALLAPLFWAFGSTGQGLIAASLLVHALSAALVVVAAGGERRWQRPLMGALLLLYVLRMPAVVFVNIWNPFALLLPTMLFLLVAARAGGSLAALATTVLLGSYLVQTHVGTVPLVGLVGLTALVTVGWRLLRRTQDRPDRSEWRRTGFALAGTVLIWVPPMWQQLTASGPGNLGLLAQYFVSGSPEGEVTHTWTEAFSAVGQLLGSAVYGWPVTPAPVRTILTAAVVCAVLVQVVGGLAVALIGHWVGQPQAGRLGLVTVAACLAGLVAARTVTGELQNYLLLWLTVLPPLLLFAGMSLVLGRSATAGREVPRLALVGTVTAAVLAAGVGVSVQRSASTLPSQPAADEAARLALDALPAAEEGDPPVLLDITDVSAWTTATSVALELELAGHRVSVDEAWVYSFGRDRASTGNEEWRLSLVPVTGGEPRLSGELGVVPAINGPTAVLLARAGEE